MTEDEVLLRSRRTWPLMVVILVLASALVVQTATLISSSNTSRDALLHVKRWEAIAKDWKDVAGRFEKIAQTNFETASSCIATLRKQVGQ